MKLLKNPGSTIVSANQPTAPPPVVIIITDTGNQHLTSPTSSVIDIGPPSTLTNHHHKSHLQQAIRAEQDYLKETSAEFLEAIGKFLGAIFRWLVWRVVLPASVAGILIALLK